MREPVESDNKPYDLTEEQKDNLRELNDNLCTPTKGEKFMSDETVDEYAKRTEDIFRK